MNKIEIVKEEIANCEYSIKDLEENRHQITGLNVENYIERYKVILEALNLYLKLNEIKNNYEATIEDEAYQSEWENKLHKIETRIWDVLKEIE